MREILPKPAWLTGAWEKINFLTDCGIKGTGMFEKLFGVRCSWPFVRCEGLAGLTTFMTMAYIIFVQPAVLSGAMFGFSTGMDAGAVMVATCLSAAFASMLMGLLANYPIALAPGMGENFFFVFTVIPACAALQLGGRAPWQTAMGVVFVSGLLFMLVSLLGLRRAIMEAMSPTLKHAAAVGIGIFIAFIGLQNGGIIAGNPGTLVTMSPSLFKADTAIFLTGLVLTAALFARRVTGAMLWGIIAAGVLAALLGRIEPQLPVSRPPSLAPLFMQMDVAGVFAHLGGMLPYIIIFLFMDVFDTVGTLVGVAEQGGFMRDNRLPRAGRALLTDAAGTVAGSILGTSTVTSFIESCTGVEQGGRTGLTACFVAVLFLAALFFSPLVGMVVACKAVTAPALVVVGAMMMRNIRHFEWDNYSELIPAFLTVIGIPLTYSIADGLALGFISYPLIKLFSGKIRETGWLACVLGLVLILYFIFVRAPLAPG